MGIKNKNISHTITYKNINIKRPVPIQINIVTFIYVVLKYFIH